MKIIGKNENQINTSIKLPLKIAIDITNDKKLEVLKIQLKNLIWSHQYLYQLDNKMIYL